MFSLVALLLLVAPAPPDRSGPRTLATPAGLATALPPAGLRIATRTDGRLRPARLLVLSLDQTGLHLLGEAPATAYSAALRWLDGHTLYFAASDDESRTTRVTRFVDGVAAETTTVTASDWQLRTNETAPTTVDLFLGGNTAATSQRWLAGCVRVPDDFAPCKTTRYLRIDVSPFVTSKRRPATRKVDKDRGLAALPEAQPPVGVAVKLTREFGTPALVCTSPGGGTIWPPDSGDFETRPKKLRWVHPTPPIFIVEGPHTWPMGDVSTEREAFVACEPAPMADFRWLGNGVWARHQTASDEGQAIPQAMWSFYLNDVLIAETPGDDDSDFAIAPH